MQDQNEYYKTLAHHTWGADKKSLLKIYKSLILSQNNFL